MHRAKPVFPRAASYGHAKSLFTVEDRTRPYISCPDCVWPTEISRDFICNVTSSAWDYLAKSGQDGWLERSGDGASLGQEYGAVSGGIGCQRIAFVND